MYERHESLDDQSFYKSSDQNTTPHFIIKDLGVILESKLLFENHIFHVTKTAFFHLWNNAKLQNSICFWCRKATPCIKLMTSRLDYCSTLQSACPASVNKLIQNAAPSVLARPRIYYLITPILSSLDWLPLKFCFSFKILLLIKPYIVALLCIYQCLWKCISLQSIMLFKVTKL